MWSQRGFLKNKGLPQSSRLVSFFTNEFTKTTILNVGCQKLSTKPHLGTQLKSSQANGFVKDAEDSQCGVTCLRTASLGELSGSGHMLVSSGQNQRLSITEDLCPAGNPTLSLGMLTSSLHWVVLVCLGC